MAEKNDNGISCPIVLIGAFLLVLLLWGGGLMTGESLLLNVLFWAGIITLAWWVVLKQSVRARRTGEPLEILKRRYASGEIGKTEYLRIKHEISK